uniref:Elongator complex protein 6 n=1 Tax=Anthurium amnicola TaxID=1678845 RepID=A0A1D1XVH7_9ARAE
MSATSSSSGNLLDEALGTASGSAAASSTGRRFLLVEDCVETSGAFVLHHLLKRALSNSESKEAVIFLALAQAFPHYDRVMRKLGCNLSTQRDKKKLYFFEMPKLQCPGETGRNDNEVGFIDLYAKMQRTVEICLSPEYDVDHIKIMVDDISLLEIAARGSMDHVLDFLHYCITLTSEMDCSLVILNHEDIYSGTEAPTLRSYLKYLADIIIKTQPLPSGLSADVHGQLTILNYKCMGEYGHSWSRMQNFHFKVKENSVDYFYPGRLTGVA